MWANPGCDMASFHALCGAKANLELIELARSLIVNLRVVRVAANYLALSITAIHRWEGKSANEWHHKVLFIFEELHQSSCVFGYLYRHFFHWWDAVRPPLLWSQNTVKGDFAAHSVPKPGCSVWGCTRPARLPCPFMETVLGLIIPSCASSPSPAGLRVPVSSAKTPQSHRSQGETEGKAQAWRVGASLHTFKV